MPPAEPAAIFVPIADLVPWSRNPRLNDGAPVERVASSIRRFGFTAPVVAWKSRRQIVAGHTRVKAMQALLGEDPTYVPAGCPAVGVVPVRFVEFASQNEADAYALADNQLTIATPYDDEGLAEILRDLDGADVDLSGLGWSDAELYTLIGAGQEPENPDGDDDDETPLPVPAEPVSRAGEVYELGPHRLVCGSSTDAGAWEALLGDERLQMIWTDPPYGVSVNAVESVEEAKKLRRRTDGKIVQNDSLTPDQLRQFLTDTLGLAVAYAEPGTAVYVAAPLGPLHNVFGDVLIALDVWKRSLIWVKDVFVMGRGDQHYRHEPIFYGWTPGAGHYWCGRRDIDTVFEVPRPKRSKEHPTMKPVALVRQHIEHSSQKGWIVGEPFGGSGTTLIAAAVSRRIARLIELDPGYCDVIRRRWMRWAVKNGQDPGAGALEG